MMSERRSDLQLAAQLKELYLEPAPSYRFDVLEQTQRTRQRPRRTFPERWSPRWLDADASARRIRLVAVIALAILAAMAAASIGGRVPPPPHQPYRLVFSTIGDLSAPAIGNVTTPIAVTLSDGRVLIAGGADGPAPDRRDALVIDPVTHAVVRVAPGLNGLGAGVLLADGRVFLIAHDQNATSSFAYLFDPTTMAMRPLPQPGWSNSPPFGVQPSMALLDDGRVLVAGGQRDVYRPDLSASALLFDPVTESFTPTGSLTTARWRHAMVSLEDGRIIVIGGHGAIPGPEVERPLERGDLQPLSSVEVFDPRTGAFSVVGSLTGIEGPVIAVPLGGDRVAVFERWISSFDLVLISHEDPAAVIPLPDDPTRVVILDAGSGGTTPAGEIEGVPETATRLRDGRVLLTGSRGLPGAWTRWATIFDPADGTTASIAAGRTRLGSAVALPDGRVVIAGGPATADDGEKPLIEIFE